MALKIDTEARIERVRLENQASSLASPVAGYSQIYAMTTGSMRGLYIEYAGGQYDPLISAYPFDGRLTVSGSNPVPTNDISAAGKLYYTPYVGNRLTLLDANGSPEVHTFNELEWSVSTSGTATYDAFVYDNAGTLTLEIVGWTSPIVRANTPVRYNGIYVKSGDITRSYLGTFYSETTNEIESTIVQRFLWNYYNRIPQRMFRLEATSHTYNTNTWRPWNNNQANAQLEFVNGIVEDEFYVNVHANIVAGAAERWPAVTIGYDTTSASSFPDIDIANRNANHIAAAASGPHVPDIGKHYYCINEIEWSVNTSTFVNASINAVVFA